MSTQNTIQFTQGDSITIRLYFTDANTGAPVDVTGGTFSTSMLGMIGSVQTFANSLHTIIDGPGGVVDLALDEAASATVEVGRNKDIISACTQSGKPLTYRGQGILQVFPPVPLQ